MENQFINWEQFALIDMRVGTILSAEVFKKARKPAYILHIDFGDLGHRKSSAQITTLYDAERLIGQQIIAVVNFPPKQIADIKSECLVLGSIADDGTVTLLQPERKAKNGEKIG